MADFIRCKLDELKHAYQSPRLYISEYFSNLRNTIDIACIENARNGDPGNHKQLLMINEVNAFEERCLTRFTNDLIDKEPLLDTVRQVESVLANTKCPSQHEVCMLDQLIYERLTSLQKSLFHNQTVLFLSSGSCLYKIHELEIVSQCGKLIVVEDEFIGERGYLVNK